MYEITHNGELYVIESRGDAGPKFYVDGEWVAIAKDRIDFFCPKIGLYHYARKRFVMEVAGK